MINWILSFIVCSGLFLAAYHFILKNESLYRFNRFFLLFALVFPTFLPLTTVRLPEKLGQIEAQLFKSKQPVSAANITAIQAQPIILHAQGFAIDNTTATKPLVSQVTDVVIKPGIDWLKLLWVLYALPALLLLMRFVRNSYFIGRVIKNKPVVRDQSLNLVLIDDEVTPHSFYKYIFLNKDDYESGQIEPQIICHEQAHINQLHSLDVVFAELMQVLFWFNPFIPFYKRAIQLNHEFLADEAVTKMYSDISGYQHLLLAKSSLPGSMTLTSQFNYLTLKNRLIMMTKSTSAKMAFIKGFSLLLFIAVLVIAFGRKVYSQSGSQIKKSAVAFQDRGTDAPKQPANQSVIDQYQAILKQLNLDEYHPVAMEKKVTPQVKAKLKALYLQMDQQQRDMQWMKFVQEGSSLSQYETVPTEKQLSDWQNAKIYGVYINDKRVVNSKLANYNPTDFAWVYTRENTSAPSRKAEGFDCMVSLKTKAFYAKYKKEALADTTWYMAYNRSKFNEINNVVGKNAKIAIPASQLQTIAPAATAAPKAILDEYHSLVATYGLPQAISLIDAVIRIVPKKDRLQMQNLFNQMNYEQQKQESIQFGPLVIPGPPQKPTLKFLQAWAIQKQYPIFIDGKKIIPETLLKHKPEEFANFNYGGVFHHMDELNGGIYLMTPAYYNDEKIRITTNHLQLPMVNDKLFAAKQKQSYSRETRRNKAGDEYDRIAIRTTAGSYAETEVSHGGRVAFFIDSTYYDENAIKSMTQKDIGFPMAVAVQDIRQKDHPHLNLHGYEAAFVFVTYPDKDMFKKVLNKKWVNRIPEIAAELKNQKTLQLML